MKKSRFGGRAKVDYIDRFLLLSLLCSVFAIAYFSTFSIGYTIGPNYRNISVDTTANITNAAPEILTLTITDPITLTAGSYTLVECNTSIRDWNSAATLDTVNGTFFHSSSSLFAANDNNTHYTNASCTQIGISGFYANYTCTFPVYYYANASE